MGCNKSSSKRGEGHLTLRSPNVWGPENVVTFGGGVISPVDYTRIL